jgi:CRP/FNR family transcriptional regulator, cyclic AMP receptor protein
MSIGHKHWTIANGWIPPLGDETVAFLNVSPQEAHVQILVYYSDRDLVGPYHLTVPAERMRRVPFNCLGGPGTDSARYSLRQHDRVRRSDCGTASKDSFPKSLVENESAHRANCNQLSAEQMNPPELANDIAAIPFLKGMNDQHLRVLAGSASRIHIEKGTIIFHQGETANRFFLMEEGTIQLELALKSVERSIVAGTIGRNGVVGWSWLFPPYQWQFTARALTKHTPSFLRDRPAGTLGTDPSAGFELFKRMGKQMVTRLQSARRRPLEAEPAGCSRVGAERAINSEA